VFTEWTIGWIYETLPEDLDDVKCTHPLNMSAFKSCMIDVGHAYIRMQLLARVRPCNHIYSISLDCRLDQSDHDHTYSMIFAYTMHRIYNQLSTFTWPAWREGGQCQHRITIACFWENDVSTGLFIQGRAQTSTCASGRCKTRKRVHLLTPF
jgi:hypothetical protein